MQNLVELIYDMSLLAKKLVDIACEESLEGSYVYDYDEIAKMVGRNLDYDDWEEIVDALWSDERVADVDKDDWHDELCLYLYTDYVKNYVPYGDTAYADYSQNMPCDTYGIGACSPSCPKFYECN